MYKIQLFIIALLTFGFLVSCDQQTETSYNKDIAPLLITCSNQYCHGTGAVNFIDYKSTVNTINDGRVLGALRQDEGFKAMPFGNEEEGKWSSEDIQLLEDWIAEGMPK